eukprot:3077738-Prymnesium_polylepis.1
MSIASAHGTLSRISSLSSNNWMQPDGGAFAALHEDGSVSAWGSPDFGGAVPTTVTSPASPVVSLISENKGFAALHEDGS